VVKSIYIQVPMNYFYSNIGQIRYLNSQSKLWHCRSADIPIYAYFTIGLDPKRLKDIILEYGFEPRSGQTKNYKIGICCFFANHAALRRKNKDWLARNQDDVSKWGDMFICILLFQWACWSSKKRTSSSSDWKLTCSRHDIAEKLLS
jgi:hypothetical protein